LQIVEGYSNALPLLTRKVSASYGNVSPAVGDKLAAVFGRRISPEEAVAQIVADISARGDSAIREYTLKIDGMALEYFEVPREEIKAAYSEVDKGFIAALQIAAGRIRSFHEEQKKAIWHGVGGSEWGQLVRPLRRVGFYVPGGTASYPSTVLATVVPAKVAGVNEAVVCTPPQKNGSIPPMTLVAADIAGVDRVFRIGGAQAVAAMAYGTETVPRVDKICGPGNVFVMLAKKMVFGMVGIDALQGPSEVLVIADEKANPGYCAADLLAQAEHDTLAQAVLITTSRKLAGAVQKELETRLRTLTRAKIAGESLEKNGVIAIVSSLDEAIELGNIFAPEHLELLIENAENYIDNISNAGCIFAGKYATEPIGDYVAGPSHALPTGGTARFSSPLNILDFIKITDVVKVSPDLMRRIGPAAVTIAKAEGLTAHAAAVAERLEDLK
jgi:histidinol dehydrogenase